MKINPEDCRVETLVGSLIYMMTAYRRGRRDLALSIAAHLECLARHPDAGQSVRKVAFGTCDEWMRAAEAKDECTAARPGSLN